MLMYIKIPLVMMVASDEVPNRDLDDVGHISGFRSAFDVTRSLQSHKIAAASRRVQNDGLSYSRHTKCCSDSSVVAAVINCGLVRTRAVRLVGLS